MADLEMVLLVVRHVAALTQRHKGHDEPVEAQTFANASSSLCAVQMSYARTRNEAVRTMKTSFLIAITIALFVCGLTACAGGSASSGAAGELNKGTGKTMRAFRSERELARYVRQLADRPTGHSAGAGGSVADSTPQLQISNAADSVTNTQHDGVDEGGIVKVHGNHLVVLRRGRLFTVAIGDGALKPISTVDAFGPDIDPRHTWYDEMLVSEETIVVIGYSYERGGTEVGLFK